MATIMKRTPPTTFEIDSFLKEIDFNLPIGFMDFFKETNGADIWNDEEYIILWPITDMIQFNRKYNIEKYIPGFFMFGSNGGDASFGIEKKTGNIYKIPFISISLEEAIFKNETFIGFIENL